MGYTGRYHVGRDSTAYRYGGGLLHGAARLHLPISERATFVLEPGLSLFLRRRPLPGFSAGSPPAGLAQL